MLLLLAAACGPADQEDSCGIPTDEIAVVATAVQNGVTLRAEAEFSTATTSGDGTLSLCDADQLVIAGAEAERVDRPDRVTYSHTSEMIDAGSVTFELQREDETSVSFTIEVPPTFEVTSPMPGAEISRSSEFILSWSPPNDGDVMRIELAEEIGNGVCLETHVAEHDYKGLAGVDIEDDGDWNIPAAVIDSGARDMCEASYRFTRRQDSAYPGELLAGGYLEGRVERLVAFVSVP